MKVTYHIIKKQLPRPSKTGSTHRHQNLARTGIRVSSMRDEVIVEDKNISLEPWEHYGLSPKNFSDSIQIFIRNRAAVTIKSMSWQVVDATSIEQRSTMPFVKIRHVP